MRKTPISEAKTKFCELVRLVRKTGKEVVITKNGTPAAVLVSQEEFESWRETLRITADAGFMDEIRAGRAGLKKAKVLLTLAELFDRS